MPLDCRKYDILGAGLIQTCACHAQKIDCAMGDLNSFEKKAS